MSTAKAKICGLTTPEAVQAAMDGAASHVGFMFFDPSPRNLRPELAARLAEPLRVRSPVKVVAVTVDPSDAEVTAIVRALRPDLIQLHGRESPERTAAVRALAGVPVIKAIGVRVAQGRGARFDWTLLDGLALDRPWFLAGGLDPWNVAEAVRASRAPLVDVSSGVERGPGVKDPHLIAAFLDAVRRA
jgi:phosphoribosylanthranilate isomerase